MVPGRYNIICPQGSTYQQEFTYKIDGVVVDLTGWDARMQVRESHASTATVLNLITETFDIAIDGPNGTIQVTIDSAVTANLKPKEYVYDLEVIDTLFAVSRLIEGKFIVTPEVTR